MIHERERSLKVYNVVALAALAVPAAALAGPAVAQAHPKPVPGTSSEVATPLPTTPGPITGTVVNPGPLVGTMPIMGTVVSPGPDAIAILQNGPIRGFAADGTPIMGTVVNPGTRHHPRFQGGNRRPTR